MSILNQFEVITRRKAIKRMSVGAMLAMGIWPGAQSTRADQGEKGTFRFLAINDTHYLTPECGPWFEKVVAQMQTEQAEFCLHCGDVTEKGKKEHLGIMKDLFSGLGIPVYPVRGNHDVPAGDLEAYRTVYPDRLNYHFEHRGWQFIGLDSTDGPEYEKTKISKSTLDWVDKTLPYLSITRPTVVFSHFPFGQAVRYRPSNTDALLERFARYNVRGIVNGHFHGYTLRQHGDYFITTNRCCALKRANHDKTPVKGYLVCDVRDGIMTHHFVEFRTGTSGATA